MSACWVILHAFLSSMDFFFTYFFKKKIFQEYHLNFKQFGSRSGPNFVRTVCKGYQQMTKVTTSRERVKIKGKIALNFFCHTCASMDDHHDHDVLHLKPTAGRVPDQYSS